MTSSPAAEPLIVTLALDDASQQLFDRLREEHFPAHHNVLRSHVTMFHDLPGERVAAVLSDVRRACRDRPAFDIAVPGLRSLGRGVAFVLESPDASSVRGELALDWEPWLTAQDRQRFRPHVTVANKVTAERARSLHEELSRGFSPFAVHATGVSVWRYLAGPWALVEPVPFDKPPSSDS